MQRSHIQIDTILLTSLAQTFTEWTGNALLVDVEAHGRVELFENVDVSRTVGWFTNLYPIQLDLTNADCLETALNAVKEQINVPNQGIDYSVYRFLKPDLTGNAQFKHQAEVCFNYLGQVDTQLSASNIFASQVSLGLTQDPAASRCYLIEINASVIGGELKFIWTYSPQHRESTIVNLAQVYLQKIRQLIEYFLSQKQAGGFADFKPLIQLEQNQLDDILAQVEFDT